MAVKNSEGATLTRSSEGAITPWSPFEEFGSLRRHMDDLFARAFGYTPLSRMLSPDVFNYEAPMDIYDSETQIDLYVALPGYAPESIKASATPESITIEAEKIPFYNEKAILRKQGWVASPGTFNVTYTLPSEIDPKTVQATFTNGVLHLVLPKTAQARTTSVPVKVTPA